MPYVVAALLAYLIGSIPFGLVLTRIAGYGDIRSIGSGNIGATNVLRTGNKKLAALTLLFDIGKGVVAVLVGQYFGPDFALVAAAGVVLGHLFPVWLGFKGGKGVATAGGVILALAWPVGLCAAAVWLALAFAFRYSSLAALCAAASAPIAAWLVTADPQRTALIACIALLVIARHHTNIGPPAARRGEQDQAQQVVSRPHPALSR